MLLSATGRFHQLQPPLGWETARRKVKNSRIWLLEAPTLQMLGKKLLKQPIFITPSPAAVRLRGNITSASAPPASPIATAGLQWDTAAEAVAAGHLLSLQKPKAQKRRH